MNRITAAQARVLAALYLGDAETVEGELFIRGRKVRATTIEALESLHCVWMNDTSYVLTEYGELSLGYLHNKQRQRDGGWFTESQMSRIVARKEERLRAEEQL